VRISRYSRSGIFPFKRQNGSFPLYPWRNYTHRGRSSLRAVLANHGAIQGVNGQFSPVIPSSICARKVCFWRFWPNQAALWRENNLLIKPVPRCENGTKTLEKTVLRGFHLIVQTPGYSPRVSSSSVFTSRYSCWFSSFCPLFPLQNVTQAGLIWCKRAERCKTV